MAEEVRFSELKNSQQRKSGLKNSQPDNRKLKNSIPLSQFQETFGQPKKESIMSSKIESLPRESKVENFDSFKQNLDNIQESNPPDETLLITQNDNQNTGEQTFNSDLLNNSGQLPDTKQKQHKPIFKRAVESKKGSKIAELTGMTQSGGKKGLGSFLKGFWN